VRRILRRLLLLAAAVGAVVVWVSLGKPSFSQMVDRATAPIFRSKAAVKESELNRVGDQAVTVVTDQNEAPVGTLREGMSFREVRELLGQPTATEDLPREKGKIDRVRWTYAAAHRVLLFEDGRLVSIIVR
jgi:hypothetical protein